MSESIRTVPESVSGNDGVSDARSSADNGSSAERGLPARSHREVLSPQRRGRPRCARGETRLMALLDVKNLVKEFSRKRGILSAPSVVRAVDDVSFSIGEGETFGLVGESGSGKTTTGRCILRLIEPTSGHVRFRDEDVLSFSRTRMRQARREMQIVFQDPFSSLNPRMRVGSIVEEPLVIHGVGDRQHRKARVTELFELVGLDPSQMARYPHQFSGGQR